MSTKNHRFEICGYLRVSKRVEKGVVSTCKLVHFGYILECTTHVPLSMYSMCMHVQYLAHDRTSHEACCRSPLGERQACDCDRNMLAGVDFKAGADEV